MMKTLLQALRAVLVIVLVTGVLYPLAITAIAQLSMARQANGSLLTRDGKVVGSALIGQPFEGPEWFHSRPSAASYDASASGGSNLGPTSAELAAQIKEQVAIVMKNEAPFNPGLTPAGLPADLVTSSSSGLDPHISVDAANLQIGRVADARGMSPDQVRALVDDASEQPTFGVLGRPRVNVLELNLTLAAAAA